MSEKKKELSEEEMKKVQGGLAASRRKMPAGSEPLATDRAPGGGLSGSDDPDDNIDRADSPTPL